MSTLLPFINLKIIAIFTNGAGQTVLFPYHKNYVILSLRDIHVSFSTKSKLFHWLTRASLLSVVKDTIIQNSHSLQPYEIIPRSGLIQKNNFT